jgi:hypothetical protein
MTTPVTSQARNSSGPIDGSISIVAARRQRRGRRRQGAAPPSEQDDGSGVPASGEHQPANVENMVVSQSAGGENASVARTEQVPVGLGEPKNWTATNAPVSRR